MVGTRRLSEIEEQARGALRLPEGPLVVALSGGADSASLLWMVERLGREARALHVDHGLEHSGAMREAASMVAEQVGVAFEVGEVELPPGASPEGRARTARYQAFGKLVPDGEALLTAHTSDDNVETVLINLVRGTGTRGLAGIPPFRPPNIHRPALGVSRDLMRELAVLAGLPFLDDPMNSDQSLTRNRLRMRVLPLLKEINPALRDSIDRMAAAVRSDVDFLDSLVPGVGSDSEQEARLPIGVLRAAPRPIADRIIRAALHGLGGQVESAHVQRVWEVVTGGSARQELGHGVEAQAEGPLVVIGPAPVGDPATAELSPGVTRHRGMVFEVVRHAGVCLVAPLGNWAAVFPAGVRLGVDGDGVVTADGEPAWIPGGKRLPAAWYRPGDLGYLSVFAREESGWTSSP